MYRFILDEEAVTAFPQFEPKEQAYLVRAFEDVAKHPLRSTLASMRDNDGRENFFIRIGEFLLTFQLDHAVRQVRVVGIERI